MSELIWVSADEVIAGDRVAVPSSDAAGGGLRTVITTQPDLDRAGVLLINHDGGTYAVAYDSDVQIAPNPAMGECDAIPAAATQSPDSAPVSHVRTR